MSLHLAHNFLSEDDAEHLLEEVLHMPEDWWFTAYKANDTRIIGNKGVGPAFINKVEIVLDSIKTFSNTDDLFNNPKDDYTKKLISSVPSPIPLAK